MSTGPEGTWQSAGGADELWEGETSFQRLGDGTAVLLVNTDGTVKAFRGLCPHQDSALDDADFDGEIITCVAHMWEFDARTGAGVNPTSTCLPQYPTEVRDGEIYVCTPVPASQKASVE
ncbi:Rieske 2Fe-2S domain-containing protein [Pseudonocardia sp. GCM10023141]|uniref:Rieske 2Fe-2S domain-containing protein n=1 Tax=Pseudonocardia sp. GCM10023141 TaxID=3252653 RepID=UPI00360FE0DB